MNELNKYKEEIFESIKYLDEEGREYWEARELMPLLQYSKWERFSNVIENAKIACKNSGYNVNDHFPVVGKMVMIGSGTSRKI